MARERILPTPSQARDGVPLALENAARHLDAARVLAVEQLYGPAVAHLVYTIEETEKARAFGQIWLNSWQRRGPGDATDDQLRDRIFNHSARHKAAAMKSWASGPFWTAMAAETRERVRLSPGRTQQERVAEAYAQHPEALPLDWEKHAASIREGALYVDLRADGWNTPGQITAANFESMRPMAVAYLRGAIGAFERHKSDFEHRPQ
jgi:AbiV family abortive infection protein